MDTNASGRTVDRNLGVAGLLAAMMAGAAARADVIASVDFDEGEAFGWTANGVETLEVDDRGGLFLHLPLEAFNIVSLNARETQTQMLGDLSRYGAFRISFDVRVFQAFNFFGDPLDTSAFSLVLQFMNYGDPQYGVVSVYTIGRAMPLAEDGWVRVTFEVPDPSQAALPANWGGTGAEGPFGDPILPPDRTYAGVLSRVDELLVSTAVPGFFYGANFWEVGFDNILIETLGDSCAADFNGDGFVDFFDFDDFVVCFEGGACPPGRTADFNGDGFVDFFDYDDFVVSFEAGC